MQLYRDCEGIAFSEVRGVWVPEYVGDWPKVRRTKNPEVCQFMHDRWLPYPCWFCGGELPLQAHHIASGARKSDECCCIFMCCEKCHVLVQGSRSLLGAVLYRKWLQDQIHTSWRRLTLLVGRHLPELDTRPYREVMGV